MRGHQRSSEVIRGHERTCALAPRGTRAESTRAACSWASSLKRPSTSDRINGWITPAVTIASASPERQDATDSAMFESDQSAYLWGEKGEGRRGEHMYARCSRATRARTPGHS